MTIRLLKIFLYLAICVTLVAGTIGLVAVIGNIGDGSAVATTLPLRIDPASSIPVNDHSGVSVGTLSLDRGTLNVRAGGIGYATLQWLDIMLTCGLWIGIFAMTLRLIDQIGSGEPFNAVAVRRLRLAGWLLIGLNVWSWVRELALPPVLLSAINPTAGDVRILPTISQSLSGFQNARVDGQLGLGLLAAGALVLILSEAFRLGTQLREDNESIL